MTRKVVGDAKRDPRLDPPSDATSVLSQTPLAVRTLRGGGIQGDLSAYALPDLLQFLNSLRKDGQLVIERPQPAQSASLSFIEGRLVHAYCPPLQGEECLQYLLDWRAGRFIFLAEAAPDRETIRRDFRTVLLDAVRQHDELTQVLAGMPPRETVFHRDRNQVRLADAALDSYQWRSLARVDGVATFGELIDAAPRAQLALARSLGGLLAAGLITTTPGYGFLGAIILRAVAEDLDLGSLPEALLTRAVLGACNGTRSLRDIQLELACQESTLCDIAESLYHALAVELVQGHNEWDLYFSRV